MKNAMIRKSKGVSVFGFILIILLVLLLAGAGYCWFAATRNALPEAPESITSEEDLYNNITKGIVLTGYNTFSTEDLNGTLEIARVAANKALKNDNVNFEITSLYGELSGSELICYMRADTAHGSFNFTVNAQVDYTSPEALIYVTGVKVGTLKLPVTWVMKEVAKYSMPENITVRDNMFVYNTENLNALLIETARQNSTISKVESTIDDILSIFGKSFKLEDVIDFKITDIYIENSTLTVKSDLFK